MEKSIEKCYNMEAKSIEKCINAIKWAFEDILYIAHRPHQIAKIPDFIRVF